MSSHLLAMLLAPFRTGFTHPTWRKILILLEGTLLARGRRTVTSALRMMGLHQLAQFNVFHHVPPSSALVAFADEQSTLPFAGPHSRPCWGAHSVGC